MDKKKYYKNNKNYYKNNHKKEKNVSNKKLTYDEIVNVRNDVSEIKVIEKNNDNIPTIRLVAISIVILAIIFGSLLVFRII